MLHYAYLLPTIGATTAEHERNFANILNRFRQHLANVIEAYKHNGSIRLSFNHVWRPRAPGAPRTLASADGTANTRQKATRGEEEKKALDAVPLVEQADLLLFQPQDELLVAVTFLPPVKFTRCQNRFSRTRKRM